MKSKNVHISTFLEKSEGSTHEEESYIFLMPIPSICCAYIRGLSDKAKKKALENQGLKNLDITSVCGCVFKEFNVFLGDFFIF